MLLMTIARHNRSRMYHFSFRAIGPNICSASLCSLVNYSSPPPLPFLPPQRTVPCPPTRSTLLNFRGHLCANLIMFGPPPSIWLVIFTFLSSVCAYTIDDSNYSVLKFSENPAGPVWGPFGSDTGEQLSIRLPNGTMMAINSAQCYDGT